MRYPQFQFSVLRSLFEMLNFAAISYSTYCSYNYVYSFNIPYIDTLSLVIGFILFNLSNCFTIYLESIGTEGSMGLVYGVFYLFTFTSGVFSSNGLINIISTYIGNNATIILSTVAGGSVISLYPNIYRIHLGALNNRNIIRHSISFYLLLCNYAFLTFILYSYIYWP